MKVNNFSGVQKNNVSFKGNQSDICSLGQDSGIVAARGSASTKVMTNLAQTDPAALQDLLERRVADTQSRSVETVQRRPASEPNSYMAVMTNLAQTNPAALQDLLERRIAATQSKY